MVNRKVGVNLFKTPRQIENKGCKEALGNLLKCNICHTNKIRVYVFRGLHVLKLCNECMTNHAQYYPYIYSKEYPPEIIELFFSFSEKSKDYVHWGCRGTKDEGWQNT